MSYHYTEFYRGKPGKQKGRWKIRFVFENGKRRKIMFDSSEGYVRFIDAVRAWNSVRKAKFTIRKIK